jgi:hypothetical protein
LRYRLVKQGDNKYVLVSSGGLEIDISNEIDKEIESKYNEMEKHGYSECDLITDLVNSMSEMESRNARMISELIEVLSKYID